MLSAISVFGSLSPETHELSSLQNCLSLGQRNVLSLAFKGRHFTKCMLEGYFHIYAKMEVKLLSTMSGNALDLTPCVKGSILEFRIRKMLISGWTHMIFFLCNTSDNTVALSCVCRLSIMMTPPTFGNITCFSLGNTPPQFPTPAFSPRGSAGAYSTFSFPPAGGHNMKSWLIEVTVIVSWIGL